VPADAQCDYGCESSNKIQEQNEKIFRVPADVHAYVRINDHMYVCTIICTYTRKQAQYDALCVMCIRAHMLVYVHYVYMHACICTYTIYACIHAYVCTLCIHAYMHMCVRYVYMHACTCVYQWKQVAS